MFHTAWMWRLVVQVNQPIDVPVKTHIEERDGGRNDDVDDSLCKLLWPNYPRCLHWLFKKNSNGKAAKLSFQTLGIACDK